MSFASAERLERYLGLSQGEVSPFGIINDTNQQVEVVFDSDLVGSQKLGFHPNDNTATIWVSYDDINEFVTQHGNPIKIIEL